VNAAQLVLTEFKARRVQRAQLAHRAQQANAAQQVPTVHAEPLATKV
jgi:hypothetical protein